MRSYSSIGMDTLLGSRERAERVVATEALKFLMKEEDKSDDAKKTLVSYGKYYSFEDYTLLLKIGKPSQDILNKLLAKAIHQDNKNSIEAINFYVNVYLNNKNLTVTYRGTPEMNPLKLAVMLNKENATIALCTKYLTAEDTDIYNLAKDLPEESICRQFILDQWQANTGETPDCKWFCAIL